MFSRWLWPHRYHHDFLQFDQLKALRQAILESPYLADTDLNAGFAGTYGFSLLFHREELGRAEALMPALGPHFKKVVHDKTNVLFLNPLVIHAGQGVAPHADKTLVSFVAEDPPFPFAVSVLYLSVPPEKTGGQLVFYRWFGKRIVTPEENLLVEFPGWMLHEVTPISAAEGTPPRISLVLEQYHLSERLKAEVPNWYLETSRPFQEFLRDADPDEDDEKEEEEEEEPTPGPDSAS